MYFDEGAERDGENPRRITMDRLGELVNTLSLVNSVSYTLPMMTEPYQVRNFVITYCFAVNFVYGNNACPLERRQEFVTKCYWTHWKHQP